MERDDAVRVLGILAVRDEADILAFTLDAVATWAARIFVLDNGSTDETPEILRAFASDHPEQVTVERKVCEFTDALWAQIFQAHRHEARPGDWWYRFDADELAMVDPRPLLASVPSGYDTVQGSMFTFYLTRYDIDAYMRDPEGWLQVPPQQRLHWYRNDWAEARFVRHRRWMRWVDTAWPESAHRIYPQRVPFRHYQCRSPEQVAHRLRVRRTSPTWAHEQSLNALEGFPFVDPLRGEPAWRRRLAYAHMLDYDGGQSPLRARPELLPPVPPLHGRLYTAADRVISGTPFRRFFRSIYRRLLHRPQEDDRRRPRVS